MSTEFEKVILKTSVTDTGRGISEQDITEIFRSFIQTQHDKGGTGLGLAISQKFAELMGGSLSVDSNLGQGTTFTLETPITIVDEQSLPKATPERRAIAIAEGQPTYRILVVDDRWTNRQFLMKLLEPFGFELRDASNGKEAVTIWEEWTPHLIWMDLRMPVMDGYEATKYIKSQPGGQSTIIIALTASVFEHERNLVLAEGCDDFVRKPVKEVLIFEKLSQYLGILFIYEDTIRNVKTGRVASLLGINPLANMPGTWLQDLRQAALIAKPTPIFHLIDHISAENSTVAAHLRNLVKNYQFHDIIQLVDEAREP